ncbi:ANTAR domain-containing protein [Nocardioides ungokensis]|uniref:ANTAR domain-containing protein n=1 Tax=Nocardioides ungokensis TaxID=1643322 RepID=UPI0015DE4E36|nr:ANTAR domain-containing protein [Nocardioides ungokensis]
MEPIPETVAAIEELGPFAVDGDLAERLRDMGRRVCELVPDCVALSLVSREHGVTFALVATDAEIALLDALRHLDVGPVSEPGPASRPVAQRGPPPSLPEDVLDERAWQRLAQRGAAPAVASSLTMPILTDGLTTGTVTLYAGSDNAFGGLHEQLATILGSWAPGAVTNADLPFRSRRAAERAPDLLAREGVIGRAVRALAAHLDLDLRAARRHLSRAARRAGISEAQLAEAIVRLHGRPDR